jgi:hypothetical protein
MTFLNYERQNVIINSLLRTCRKGETTFPSHVNGTCPSGFELKSLFTHFLATAFIAAESISTHFYISLSNQNRVFNCTVSHIMIFTFGRFPSLDIMPNHNVLQKQIQFVSGVHTAYMSWHFRLVFVSNILASHFSAPKL